MTHDEIVEEIGKLREASGQLRAQLEKPPTPLGRFKEYAGVVSLVLSLATGFFAVYSSFLVEPAKSRAEAQTKLHETLAQIVSLDGEYLQAIRQGDLNANNGAIETKRNILLQQVEDLANKRGVASAEDQIYLGNLYVFGNRFEPGLSHFKAAIPLSENNPLTRAAAETQIGKLEFYGIGGSTIQEGRLAFDDAERLLSKAPSRDGLLLLVQSLGLRSFVECAKGDTALGKHALLTAQDDLTRLALDPAVNPQLIDSYRVSLTTGLANTHCAESTDVAPPAATIPKTRASMNKIDLSNHMLQLLVALDYGAFESNMTATAQSQISESRLKSIWETVIALSGTYKQTLSTTASVINNTAGYIVHAKGEKGLVNLSLVFDQADRVAFFNLMPLSPLTKEQMEKKAVELVSTFFRQKFDDVFSEFDPGLQRLLTAQQLQSGFAQLINAKGDFERVKFGLKNKDFDIVDVLSQLRGGRSVIRVGYDPDMKVNGFVIGPSN